MEDILSIRAKHGHMPGKGLWWIDRILVDNKPTSIMIMFGSNVIGDKTCYRIGRGMEIWFDPDSNIRDNIIKQGKALIKKMLKDHDVKDLKGNPYKWESI